MLRSKLAQIEKTRVASQPLPAGSAPLTSSNSFKIQKFGSKVKATASPRFRKEAGNLKVSPLKAAQRDHSHPDMVSLGTARPSPQYFPWESMQLKCPDSESPGLKIPLGSGLSMGSTRGEAEYDLSIAMNYGYSAGSPQVLRYLTEHVELIHDPPYEDWEVCLTCGTTSGLEIALRLFCDPGDTILIESHAYAGTIVCARSQGLRLQTVELDEQGLKPEDLDHKLSNWDPAKGAKPTVLYTIPSGQNPTGTTQGLERRKEIYKVVEKHDIYILEDDPYYFIHLGANLSDNPSSVKPASDLSDLSDLDDYLGKLPVSYLSLDISGRVLRMDSTSKILAPGLRAGWVTATSRVIEKFIALTEVGALCPSGPTQVMLYKLLDTTWGHAGFIRWLKNLSAQYRRRRDIMVQSAKTHLPSDACIWKVPEVGMFFWIDLDLSKLSSLTQHIDSHEQWKTYLEIEEAIFSQAQDNGVLVSRGSWFMSDVTELRSVGFRLTFAAAPEEKIDRAVARFGSALRAELEKKKNGFTSIPMGALEKSEMEPVPIKKEA